MFWIWPLGIQNLYFSSSHIKVAQSPEYADVTTSQTSLKSKYPSMLTVLRAWGMIALMNLVSPQTLSYFGNRDWTICLMPDCSFLMISNKGKLWCIYVKDFLLGALEKEKGWRDWVSLVVQHVKDHPFLDGLFVHVVTCQFVFGCFWMAEIDTPARLRQGLIPWWEEQSKATTYPLWDLGMTVPCCPRSQNPGSRYLKPTSKGTMPRNYRDRECLTLPFSAFLPPETGKGQ